MAQPHGGSKEVAQFSAIHIPTMGDAQGLEVTVGKGAAVANWGSIAAHATDARLQDWSWGCGSLHQRNSVT